MNEFLKQRQTYKKATRLEKMQLEKHYMLQKINDNISDDYQSQQIGRAHV